jgi:2-(1,2-epoxy-1,2-dihydrophenyl)acetyl-CoA isomerase
MDPATTSLVRARTDRGVATLTLDRPERLNAFSLELAQTLRERLAEAAADPAVRVVVLAGQGRLFSAGGDVKQMRDDVDRGDPSAYFRDPLTAFGAAVCEIRALPKPVVAAVHGAVAGFAWNLVLACDLVVAAAGTRFAQAFIRLGLSPDGGGTWFLPRLVGYHRACELALLPGEIDAERAHALGLVNRVVAADRLEAEVAALAAELAAGPAPALARAKALLGRGLAAELAAHVEAERRAQVANAASPDFAEGLRAFADRRAPRFAAPPPPGAGDEPAR